MAAVQCTDSKSHFQSDLLGLWHSDFARGGLIASINSQRFSLLVVFLTALLVRLVSFTGLIGSDDLGYSHFAQQIASGTYHLFPHHYAIRYGVILPLALLYRTFGVHEWTTVLLPILCSSFAPALLSLVTSRLFPDCRRPWAPRNFPGGHSLRHDFGAGACLADGHTNMSADPT